MLVSHLFIKLLQDLAVFILRKAPGTIQPCLCCLVSNFDCINLFHIQVFFLYCKLDLTLVTLCSLIELFKVNHWQILNRCDWVFESVVNDRVCVP